LRVISDVKQATWSTGAPEVLAVPLPQGTPLVFGVNDAAYGRAALASAARAIKAALAGEVDAVVGAPHNQTSIAAAKIPFDGYPGFVARETGMNHHDVFLMLAFGDTRIVHCTLHVGVAEALALITRDRVGHAIRAADTALRRIGIARPSICVSGLNPHAGEGGLFGDEEETMIAPAIARAVAGGADASGPFPPDTIFRRAYAGEFDVVIALYHDQGLIPLKMVGFERGVNITLGLPFVRTSVDHGTAFDLAGTGAASAESLGAAYELACAFAACARRTT
jgi:4-hydroxythreonine-4-phosphate dehydrogenase